MLYPIPCITLLVFLFQGSWKPSQNLSTVLTSIYLLMAEPNPDDGLMPEIVCSSFFIIVFNGVHLQTKEYRENRARFIEKARASSSQHALLSPKEGGRSQRADSEKEESASSSDEAGICLYNGNIFSNFSLLKMVHRVVQ